MFRTRLQSSSGELLSKCNPLANEKNTKNKRKKQTRACGCSAEDYRVLLESCSSSVTPWRTKKIILKKQTRACGCSAEDYRVLLESCSPSVTPWRTKRIPKKKQTRACGCSAQHYKVYLESCSPSVTPWRTKRIHTRKTTDTCLWMHCRRLQGLSRELLSQSVSP